MANWGFNEIINPVKIRAANDTLAKNILKILKSIPSENTKINF